MEETNAAKRLKSHHHEFDLCSDRDPRTVEVVTTMKVFLSWCKDEKKEKPRVFELVTYLRKKLLERGIEVLDDDVERRVKKERYLPILILTVGYFDDADCLNEFKVIWKSHIVHMLPIYYDPDEEFERLYNDALTGPYWDRPLLTPLGTPWPATSVDDDNNKADAIGVDDDNNKADAIAVDDGANASDEDDMGSDDTTSDDDFDIRTVFGVGDYWFMRLEKEEELTLGNAFNHVDGFGEWLKKPIVNNSEAECAYMDHFALYVWMYLNPADLDYTCLVGLEFRLNQFCESYIFSEKEYIEPIYVAITGPEGSGKTTMAKFLYNKFCHAQSSFYHTRMISRPKSMSRSVIAEILYGDIATIGEDTGNWKPEENEYTSCFYKSRPLLIFFDNMNTLDDFEHVAPVLSLLPKNGSKVVFTTRDGSWLNPVVLGHGFRTYPIPTLDDHSALQLFCLKAFKQRQAPKGYEKLADNAVKMANGIPLDLVRRASQFSLDDSWTKAFVHVISEDMSCIILSESSKPDTTGEAEKKEDSRLFMDRSMYIRDHKNLQFKIWRCIKSNSLDYQTDRVRTIFCGL